MEEKIIETQLQKFPNVLREKYNIELIISDGGSTDKTVELAAKYADKIAIHRKENRQTIAEGRNKGAELAKGNVFVFLNADTIPWNIEEFFEFISKWYNCPNHQKYGAISCKVLPFPEEKRTSDKFFYTFLNSYFSLLNKINFGMGRGECHIIRKEIFEEADGYKNNLAAGEDFDLYRRISRFSKILSNGKPIVYESPRRFRKEGWIPVLFQWFLNSISISFRNRSLSKEWKTIR